MKRWIIYVMIIVVNAAGLTASATISDRDRDKRDKSGNTKSAATLKMKPKKISRNTAKLRKENAKERKKKMADIKKSNKQRNRKNK